MGLVVDMLRGLASRHIACRPAMSMVARQAASAEAAGMHRMAAEGNRVQESQSVRMARTEGNREMRTETALADSYRSGDRTVGGCTFPSPDRARSCEIEGFRGSESAHGIVRRR